MPELGLGFLAMDSPEPCKKLSTASDSPPVQDSPFFNYISNLSPITCSRSIHVTRELSRLNSPPIVFRSPRKKLHSETNILKRSLSLQLLSSPQASRSIKRGDECGHGSIDTDQIINGNELITETQKGCDHVVGSSETRRSSSSGCVYEFLADADPGEADCVSSAKSATPAVHQSNDAPALYRSGSKELKKTVLKFDSKSGTWANAESNLEEDLVPFEDAEDGIHEGSISGVIPNDVEEEQRDAEWPSYKYTDINTNAHVELGARGAEHEHHYDIERASEMSPELFLVETNKNHSEDAGQVSHRMVGNMIHHGHEASENLYGARKRCLQFGENHSSANKSRRTTTATNLETFKSTQSASTLSLARSSENVSMVSKPLGIGLHLNSIINASLGCTVTLGRKSTEKSSESQQIGELLENTKSCSSSSATTTCEERLCPSKAIVVASSVAYEEENESSNLQLTDVFEENDQSNPRIKRKKATSGDGGDGCKRCNCKKTKCLKLYCDCFAAGVYCSGPCSCQGCFNKPEFKDKVLETREQIISRNPLAFAPKIVKHVSELPSNNAEDGNRATPSSARHKRGCNCKKSMCLKKYCECYQSNVGCSSGCRCEGCKNVYGKKEEYVALERVAPRDLMSDIACNEQLESTFDKDSEMTEFNGDLLCTELTNPNNLTPLTPSFQHSDQGKVVPKSRFLSQRRFPSPDSSTKSMENRSRLSETHEASQIEGSYDWQVENDTNKSERRRERLLSRSVMRHGSPLTPTTGLGQAKPGQVAESGCELVEMMMMESDETPVKVSSPNKKRISPPRVGICKLGSGSSGALRSGRKFILKSVPSFPPLTPCLDKGSSVFTRNTEELQDNHSVEK